MRRAAKMFVRWSHLKLVVLLPSEEGGDGAEEREQNELCLARYECTMGNRKAGRLILVEKVMDAFLQTNAFKPTSTTGLAFLDHGQGDESNEQSIRSGKDFEKTRQRLKDVVVATALAMIIIERDKRRFLLEFLQEVGEMVGG